MTFFSLLTFSLKQNSKSVSWCLDYYFSHFTWNNWAKKPQVESRPQSSEEYLKTWKHRVLSFSLKNKKKENLKTNVYFTEYLKARIQLQRQELSSQVFVLCFLSLYVDRVAYSQPFAGSLMWLRNINQAVMKGHFWYWPCLWMALPRLQSLHSFKKAKREGERKRYALGNRLRI